MSKKIREVHLFAGIGGGIYGGSLLGHECCAGVEIDDFCTRILRQRQSDGWMNSFPVYGDIRTINGKVFRGTFDVLCGGFPCQAFSHAAHGNNIGNKNLWGEMLRFVNESKAPVVFGENVTLKAISKAGDDLKQLGYNVEICKLSCGDLGADHRRDRYWLMAVSDYSVFNLIKTNLDALPKFSSRLWAKDPFSYEITTKVTNRREQLKAIGNAQSPLVAACAFRVLADRIIKPSDNIAVSKEELSRFFKLQKTWIKGHFGDSFGFIHTPTTMANYSAPSMMKHQGCRNFKKVFDKPTPFNAEYLMGFPIGSSCEVTMGFENYKSWLEESYC